MKLDPDTQSLLERGEIRPLPLRERLSADDTKMG